MQQIEKAEDQYDCNTREILREKLSMIQEV